MSALYIELLKRSLLGEVPVSSLARHERGYCHDAVTMIGRERLDNLHDAVESVIDDGVPGHLIETGVWRGGACILMRGILKARDVTDRNVYVADSFTGLPWPDSAAYPLDKDDNHHQIPDLAVSEDTVRKNFEAYGLLDDSVKFVKGWFKDTLHRLDGPFAVIRLDGDMYGSTIEAMNALYPKLSPGGVCIVDDYSLARCCAAITDYRAKHDIAAPIHRIDWAGAYWRKP